MVEKGNIREERLYLGNYECYRKYVNNILKTERQTVHIIDDRHRFALIDRLAIDNGITLSTASNSIRYQYDNHLGSASLELDQTAAIISYEEYHPFGRTSYRSGRTETEVSQKRYKYVGKERDEETGLYYYGARYYVAWICRFVSVDQLQFRYPHYTPIQYAGNKPVSYIDLDGLEEAAAVSTYYTSPIISKFKNVEIEMEKVKEGQQKIEAFNQRFGNDTEEHIEGNLSSFISSSAFQFVRKVASHSSTAINTTQVIFEPFSKNWLSSSKGMFFMKHGDPVLDVSKGQFLEQNGILDSNMEKASLEILIR